MKISKSLKTFLLLAMAGIVINFTACSETTKAVQWEEEVPLNTGDVIWVKRTDIFVKGSEPGNPLKMTWGIDRRTYEFSWQGQQYIYQTETKTSLGAIRLHVYPAEKTIVVIDAAKNCSKPGYGEFHWRNGAWQLQKTLNSILIGQVRNLMASSPGLHGDTPARINIAYKQQADSRRNSMEKAMALDESVIAINCTEGK